MKEILITTIQWTNYTINRFLTYPIQNMGVIRTWSYEYNNKSLYNKNT